LVALLFGFVALSGCLQFGGKNFSDLKAVLEKHGLDDILAPGTIAELRDFEKDLLSLKAQASVQKGRETEALLAAIELRLAIVKMQQALLNAQEESKFIDYYNPLCSSPTSLKKTIDNLDVALAQSDLAIALANGFSGNYKDFVAVSGFDATQTVRALSETKATITEEKNKYKTFCI